MYIVLIHVEYGCIYEKLAKRSMILNHIL